MALRRTLCALVALACFAAPAAARIVVLGPTTPKAKSSHGMKMKFKPATGDAGTTFKGAAKGFEKGEYATVWEFSGKKWRHSSQLLGGSADGKGRLTVYRTTAAGISDGGKRKVCAQGERSHRVACARYKVRAPKSGGTDGGDNSYKPPTIGPGYVPPASG